MLATSLPHSEKATAAVAHTVENDSSFGCVQHECVEHRRGDLFCQCPAALTRMLVVAEGETGSTWLLQMLHAHHCAAGYFNNGKMDGKFREDGPSLIKHFRSLKASSQGSSVGATISG